MQAGRMRTQQLSVSISKELAEEENLTVQQLLDARNNANFLPFDQFVKLRLEAQRAYENPDNFKPLANWILRNGFFTNINRMDDRVSRELKAVCFRLFFQ